jgi:hypothetical protein
MARLTQPSRDAFTDQADLDAYDSVTERETGMFKDFRFDPALNAPDVGPYWGGLLNSPPMAAIAGVMGNFIRTAGERDNTYAHWERELVDQVLCADWKTNIVLKLHIPDAVATGVRLEAIEAIRYGREEELNDDERLLVRYIRAVVSGTVDDELSAKMTERLGPLGVVEYSGFIMWLAWIIRFMQVLQVPDPSDEEIDALIVGLKDGSVPVPDYRERIA